MKCDHNQVSLALCHAKAIIELVIDSCSSDPKDLALSAALHFVEDAKAMVDEQDRREPAGELAS